MLVHGPSLKGVAALRRGVRAPAWVLRDDVGQPSLLDIDWEGDRYWYAGRSYATVSELYAALGRVTIVSGRAITIGPNVAAGTPELVAGADLNSAGDIAQWTAGPNTTTSQITGGVRIGGAGTQGYIYQAITTEPGKSYVIYVDNIGSGDGQFVAGTTQNGSDIVSLKSILSNSVNGPYTFVASGTTVYLALRSHPTSASRDYGRCTCKVAVPFDGWSATAGTVAAKWTSAASLPSADETILAITDRDDTSNYNKIKIYRPRTNSGTGLAFTLSNNAVNQATLYSYYSTDHGVDTAFAATWKENDVEFYGNGIVPSITAQSVDTSATMPAWASYFFVGHQGGGSEMSGTMKRFTYFARRVQALAARPYYVSIPSGIHIIGDSFATPVFRDAIKSLYPSRVVTLQSDGGDKVAEEAGYYLASPAVHDRTLVWMDGGQNPRENDAAPDTVAGIKSAISSIHAAMGHSRWIRVQPSPTPFLGGTQGRTDWDADMAEIDAHFGSVVGADRVAYCLSALQAANDGSANDLADVAAGIVPRSLRLGSVDMHETAAGLGIRADRVKALTDAYPALLV